uniref:voltage-dependent anion-selective channel protein 2-like n=1 Tax=Myxine glutinosa TaxID=7769 RepID=UPI00358FFDB1
MERPPAYTELGRHIWDLFNLGCDPGFIRLDWKSKTCDGVEFGYCGKFGLESGRFAGNVSVGRPFSSRDLDVTSRWASDGTLGGRVDFYRLVRGVDLTFDAAFSPSTGNKLALARASLTRAALRVEAEANFEEVGTTATLSTVFRSGHWLMGAWTQLGGPNGVDTQWSGSAGYELGKRQLMVTIEGGRFLNLLMSQPFGPLDVAFSMAKPLPGVSDRVAHLADTVRKPWMLEPKRSQMRSTLGSDRCSLMMALAAKFQWGAHSTVTATVTFDGFLGLAFSHVLSPGIKLALCNSLNLNTLNSGGHAVGIGLEFES